MRFYILLFVSLCVIISDAFAQSEIYAEIAPESVHSNWETFDPEFVRHVCPFADSAPAYDPDEFVCGYVLVPEDRTKPTSRLIKLSVLKIVSTSDTPSAGAIIRLTGGPGGTSLSGGRIRAYQLSRNQRFREAADLIFFDQRGIGYSEPDFCRAIPRDVQYGVPTAPDGDALYAQNMRTCLAEASTRGIAVDAYSTWQNALDVRDIRRALGYEQWTLFGVSYGTALGQAVIQVDEEGVRAAILDSVVPVAPLEGGGWEAAAFGFRSSLTALDTACAADADCATRVGSFADRFIAAFETLDADPVIIDGMDPRAYTDGRIVLDGTLAASAVFQALYREDLYPDFPALLQAVETRNGEALKAYAGTLGRSINHREGNGMELVANCRGSAITTPEARAAMQAREPQLSKWMSAVEWTDVCPAAYRIDPDPSVTPLATNIPVLVGAGLVDPITPPHYGQSLMPRLPNGTYVEFPNTGHGVFLSYFDGCGGDILLDFANDPTEVPDTSCARDIPAPIFLAKLREGPAPYRFALQLQAGNYPIWLGLAAFTLVYTLIALPFGWLARMIEARETLELGGARIWVWAGSVISLAGLWLAISMILKTATEHPMALPIGVLPSAGWGSWLAALGFGLAGFGAYQTLRRFAEVRQKPGAFIGLIAATLAAGGVFAFLMSLGLGLF